MTSSADPSAPTDFIVDSSFPGTNEILFDVIAPLLNTTTFEETSIEEALEAAQVKADEIVARYN